MLYALLQIVPCWGGEFRSDQSDSVKTGTGRSDFLQNWQIGLVKKIVNSAHLIFCKHFITHLFK